MTADQPAGEALLEAARRLLLEELLALLPAERRYDGLMIANAMAIAARELRAVAGAADDAVVGRRMADGRRGDAGRADDGRGDSLGEKKVLERFHDGISELKWWWG